MPFKTITSIVHEGQPLTGEWLIIHTASETYTCMPKRTSAGKHLVILEEHWTHEVEQAVGKMMTALRRRGVAVEPEEITAWIDFRYGLTVGKHFVIMITCDEHARTASVKPEEVITGFTPILP